MRDPGEVKRILDEATRANTALNAIETELNHALGFELALHWHDGHGIVASMGLPAGKDLTEDQKNVLRSYHINAYDVWVCDMIPRKL